MDEKKQYQLKQKIGLIFDEALPKKFSYMNASLKKMNQGYCAICYSPFNMTNCKADSLACGHEFCASDWTDYLLQRVNDGYQQCLSTTCPQHQCNMVVPHSMFTKYLSGNDLKTYMKWFCKSYTDDNKKVRWCPFQGCDYCVEYQDFGPTDVNCRCGNAFCFKCGNESHKPADCETVR